jgi:hypothetical protein
MGSNPLLRVIALVMTLILLGCPNPTENDTGKSPPLSSAKAITVFFFVGYDAYLGVIDENAGTISVTLPFGTSLDSLVAIFMTTGTSVELGGIEQESRVTVNNFMNPVTYLVMAENGSTKTYIVTVTVAPSNAKSIVSYSFEGYDAYPGVINENAGTISVTLPAGASLDSLIAAFMTTGVSVKVDGIEQESGVTENDFFISSVMYLVTAADGSTKSYLVTVEVELNSAKSITAFSFQGYGQNPGVIDEIAGMIRVKLPFGSTDNSLIAEFTTTGASVIVEEIEQESGITANDFSNLVEYLVTAEDGSTKIYIVIVRVPYDWTWISGHYRFTAQERGRYGTKGIGDANNVPGARTKSTGWMDSNNNLWLFGGTGYDAYGDNGLLNDLWKFDGTNWTWISGSNTRRQAGSYGTKGIASPSNVPGARARSTGWVDSAGNLWLFGGNGIRNDLWKFDGTYWTWISGSDTPNQPGNYGIKGIASPSNVPGAREGSTGWIDSADNLWLLGGSRVDTDGHTDGFNDLWKFDGTSWTWISGSNTIGQDGTYGTKGVGDAYNVPGARADGVGWIDSIGNLWLFGGMAYGALGYAGLLNDLWRFDGTTWMWVSGSNSTTVDGNYGTKGIASPSNVPGARRGSTGWIDRDGNFWLFGGDGWNRVDHLHGTLNDLWKYDGTNWTWMSGSDTYGDTGIYGTKGIPSAANIPASREYCTSWIDNAGDFWIFGGLQWIGTGGNSRNDLWKCTP